VYEELPAGTPLLALQHNGGDGTSGSSHGTASPDISCRLTEMEDVVANRNDVVIRPEDIRNGNIDNSSVEIMFNNL